MRSLSTGGDTISTLTMEESPNLISSPSLSGTQVPSLTEMALTLVPLLLSVSRISQRLLVQESSACFSETEGSLIWKLAFLVRPMMKNRPSFCSLVPATGPSMTLSCNRAGFSPMFCEQDDIDMRCWLVGEISRV